MRQILRDYQVDGVNQVRQAIRDGYKRILIVAPTGSGKTTIACNGIIEPAAKKGASISFIAHRKELIDQCSARLDEHGVDHGIIKLASDQRTFTWATNGRKLMSVPFDENPYSAMAAWFKTDEGLEVYNSINKKVK